MYFYHYIVEHFSIMGSKLDTIRSDPRWVAQYLRTQATVLWTLPPLEALLYAPSIVSEVNPYERYLRYRSHNNIVRRSVLDFEMFVDLDDIGISQQLIRTGVHERQATHVFQRELYQLEDIISDVTILEIGGNIGYYTLVETAVLNDSAEVHVIEPEPGNIDLLMMNVGLNGCGSQVDVTQGAISATSGSTMLNLSEHSNCHTIEEGDERTNGKTIEIDTWTADEFLNKEGLDPKDVNVVRMDVEGHEAKIFQGMDDVLASEGAMLVFVELHQVLLENDELVGILNKIQESEFEFVYACVDHFARDPLVECDSLDEIRSILQDHGSIEVFIKKGY